jgi:hypothetical protein
MFVKMFYCVVYLVKLCISREMILNLYYVAVMLYISGAMILHLYCVGVRHLNPHTMGLIARVNGFAV